MSPCLAPNPLIPKVVNNDWPLKNVMQEKLRLRFWLRGNPVNTIICFQLT